MMTFVEVYVVAGSLLAVYLVALTDEEWIEGRTRHWLFWGMAVAVVVFWPLVLWWVMTSDEMGPR